MGTSERDLVEGIIKAVSSEETAPKPKHVRTCIVYTHQARSTAAFWSSLKLQPLFTDEVVCTKAFITVHKLIREGYQTALREAYSELPYLKKAGDQPMRSRSKGYTELIQAYVRFLSIKLEFHHTHPEFSGTMSYEDYVSLRTVSDPNEGYQTVTELMQLQQEVLNLVRIVFGSFRKNLANECRISVLVPLVEESHGIYQFITSMLRAMHASASDISVFEDLRDKYNEQYGHLYSFYDQAKALRYLTSLIAIPELDRDPPLLYDPGRRPALPSRTAPAPQLLPPPVADNSAQLRALMEQHENDRLTMASLLQRISALEAELATVKGLLFEEQHKNAELGQLYSRLKEEYDALKAKFDKLSGMYGSMRTDHLTLLKQKQEFVEGRKRLGDMQRELEQLRKARTTDASDAAQQAELLRHQYANLEASRKEEAASLRAQIEALNGTIEQLGQSKGAEVETLIKRHNAEKAQLDAERAARAAALDALRAELDDAKQRNAKLSATKDEEIAILQVSLDESLMETSQAQQSYDAKLKELEAALEAHRASQSADLNRLLDDVLGSARAKIDDSVSQFDSPLHSGNANATAQYALAHIEKVTATTTDLSNALVALAAGNGNPSSIVNLATDGAGVVDHLLENIKGITRSLDDSVAEPMIASARGIASATQQLMTRDPSGHEDARRTLQQHVDSLSAGLDGIVQSSAVSEIDVSDRVEQEMLSAAQAIEAAAARLSALLNAPVAETATPEQRVNTSLLESVMSITSAIGNLIRAATLAQQEIVAKGRGSSSAQQFYKKNHRWTEGLVSAAKAVALCTTTLVENADGVVRGTHTMEQLVVAAHEVSAATAQLVAASRVKADKNSRTQANLETAARTVGDATRLLVKAAKDAAARKLEEASRRNLSAMTVGQTKRLDMEQQVKILTLEKELTNARRELAEMRKVNYHAHSDEQGEPQHESDDEPEPPIDPTKSKPPVMPKPALAAAVAAASSNLVSAVGTTTTTQPAQAPAKKPPPPVKPKPMMT